MLTRQFLAVILALEAMIPASYELSMTHSFSVTFGLALGEDPAPLLIDKNF
ncbi:MAG: hypothetical protein WDO16_11255 [Bacteroidota bacterium]